MSKPMLQNTLPSLGKVMCFNSIESERGFRNQHEVPVLVLSLASYAVLDKH